MTSFGAELRGAELSRGLSFDQVQESLALSVAATEHIGASFDDFCPVHHNGRLSLEGADGRHLYPDPYCMMQLARIFDTGVDYTRRRLRGGSADDLDALVYAYQHGWQHVDGRKRFRFRVTRHTNTLRAVLSDQYEPIPNAWYLKVIEQAIPDGVITHLRSTSPTCFDTIRANVLIPDSVRREDDSDYAAMVAISNSEIGQCGLKQLPSVFRVVCWNGIIVPVRCKDTLSRKHRGRIDRGRLREEIIENIRGQWPVAASGVDQLLASRRKTTAGPMKPLVAEVARSERLNRQQATAVLHAWHVESRVAPEYRHSLFAVVNAVTRAGQDLSPDQWRRFDEIGGRLASLGEEDWEALSSRAERLSERQVEKAFDPSVN